MANLNLCQFIGRVGKPPETRYTASGTAVSSLSLACSEKFKNKSGEWEERTEWVNVSFWGKLAEIVQQYVAKGQEIYVAGRMQTRKWQDRDNNDRYTTEIVADKMQMFGKGKESSGGGGGGTGGNIGPDYEEPMFNPDDDIPFLLPAHLMI